MARIINIHNIINIAITVILFIDIGYLISYRKGYIPATFLLLVGLYSKAYLYYKEDIEFTRRVVISLSIATIILMISIYRIKNGNLIF